MTHLDEFLVHEAPREAWLLRMPGAQPGAEPAVIEQVSADQLEDVDEAAYHDVVIW